MPQHATQEGPSHTRLPSPEQHAMTKKMVKARQRSGSGKGKVHHGPSLFDEIQRDKAAKRARIARERAEHLAAIEARKTAAMEAQEAQKVANRTAQAQLAWEFVTDKMAFGSPAWLLVRAALEAFPNVEVPSNMSRTAAALAEAERRMATFPTNGVIKCAKRHVHTALADAYVALSAKTNVPRQANAPVQDTISASA